MIMVAKILNTQASEKHWRRLVPTRVIHTIWQSIEIPFITSNSFHLDFKIRHRRIYAGIVLHQIAKQVYSRICCMCGETDEHMFLNQQEKKKRILQQTLVKHSPCICKTSGVDQKKQCTDKKVISSQKLFPFSKLM